MFTDSNIKRAESVRMSEVCLGARAWRAIVSVILVTICLAPIYAEDDLTALEETAVQSAVRRAAPSVVQIQTVGGLDKVGRVVLGAGPTTGVIVTDDGYIVSSAFNFAQKPSSILVTLPSGKRINGRLVATDRSRMLVLLKIETDESLTPLAAVPEDQIVVGSWAIAVGRAFEGGNINMSAGIVSAVDRVLGKVLQTDAKISPNNYGGPLVNIHGRGLGILVPMSPQGQSEVAGVEWYDAGIGFAVPMAHIYRILPKLQSGKDLSPGVLGISLAKGDPYATTAKIASVRPNSPARDAGLKANDTIVAVNDRPVATTMQLRMALGARYAGETVHLRLERGSESFEYDVELVAKLDPYEHPMLGVLPLRRATDDAKTEGLAVRHVYPGTGAEQANIVPGDRIIALDDTPVNSAADAHDVLSAHGVGDQVVVKLRRGDENVQGTVILGGIPTEIPSTLPRARGERAAPDEQQPAAGVVELQLPEFKNMASVYVPEGYDAAVPHGVVLWLNAGGKGDFESILQQWKTHCDRDGLVFVIATSSDEGRWQRTDAEYLSKLLAAVIEQYTIDPLRVVLHGQQGGGAMAYRLALARRDVVRGVAVVDAPLPRLRQAPTNEPNQRLTIYSAMTAESQFAPRIRRGVTVLREARFPVTTKDLGDKARYLNGDEIAELARWIDSLDRI